MASVYILFSKQLSRFYTGSCLEIEFRLGQHLEKIYKSSFSAKTDDWESFLTINNLEYRQARNIEQHIKKMKSTQYISNLKKYPELIEKLKIKHSLPASN
jgi:putative endonuclease